MIDIPSALQAKLDAGATTLCAVWRLTRLDGQVFGFTDHDETVSLSGLDCVPNTGLSGGELCSETGSSPARTALFGALDASILTDADLDNGVWDRAQLEVFQLDWSEPELYFQTFLGELGAVRRQGVGFEVDIAGASARLSQVIGRVFSKSCDAELGDSRCGIDLTNTQYAADLVVTQLITSRAFVCSGLESFEADAFRFGVVSWTSGENQDGRARVMAHRIISDEVVIELDRAPARAIAHGDQGQIVVGCDKQFATCQSKFSNQDRFRGCPHMPGNNVLVRSASSEAIQDGSAR
jgi:uncharacterized phage protein (TIGR02218 family)